MTKVLQTNILNPNNSITKFKLFLRLVELERINDRERANKLNEFIRELIKKERESGEYISSVNLYDNRDLEELMNY